jgi:hypothetical protein
MKKKSKSGEFNKKAGRTAMELAKELGYSKTLGKLVTESTADPNSRGTTAFNRALYDTGPFSEEKVKILTALIEHSHVKNTERESTSTKNKKLPSHKK